MNVGPYYTAEMKMKISADDFVVLQQLIENNPEGIGKEDIVRCFALNGVLECEILDDGKVFKVTFVPTLVQLQLDINGKVDDIANIIKNHANFALTNVETEEISRNGCVAVVHIATFKKECSEVSHNEKVNSSQLLSPREAWETFNQADMNSIPDELISKINEAILGSIHNKLNQVLFSIPEYQKHYGDLLFLLLTSKGYAGVNMSKSYSAHERVIFFDTPSRSDLIGDTK